MLSIRALICSPDCGIKIDMRDRSVWQRRGSVAFLAGLHGNVGRRVTTPSGAVESSIAPASRNVKEIPQPAASSACIFYVLYLCNIYQREIFSLPAAPVRHCIDPEEGDTEIFVVELYTMNRDQ